MSSTPVPALASRVAARARLAVPCLALASLPAMAAFNFPLLEDVQQVSAGGAHTCAVVGDGSAMCWGLNTAGQLGDGTGTNRLLPVRVRGVGRVAAISAGTEYTCVLTSAGGVRCWGLNYDGQVGNGSGGFGMVQRTPVDVVGLTGGMVAVRTGNEHSCALTSAGGVKCWGRNNAGQLGDGSTTDRYAPVDVVGLTNGVASISVAGGETAGMTCAVTNAGALLCWGRNDRGQLGDGSVVDRHVPTPVAKLGSGVLAVAVGDSHACALVGGGSVKCWGSNGWNRLGAAGFGGDFSPTPLDVTGLSGMTSLDLRVDLACAHASGARARCWGVFHFPVGGVMPVFSPTPVERGPTATLALGVGGAGWSLRSHACALTSEARLQCWGGNTYGQLGNGSTGGYSDTHDYVLRGDDSFADGFE